MSYIESVIISVIILWIMVSIAFWIITSYHEDRWSIGDLMMIVTVPLWLPVVWIKKMLSKIKRVNDE